MNYQIIKNELAFLEFIDWLPELQHNEKFYCTLLTRKKYNPEICTDKGPLRRFVTTKERFLQKVRQLEVELGWYMFKGTVVPEDSLVLYVTPNPRSLKKACFKATKRFLELIETDGAFNIHAEALSCIQKSRSRTVFIDFDFDTKDFNLRRLQNAANTEALHIVETRGGFHVLVKLDDLHRDYKKSFYKEISNMGADQQGDLLLPVPGCVQGDFVPRFVYLPFTTDEIVCAQQMTAFKAHLELEKTYGNN